LDGECLVLKLAVIINCILFASNGLRDNGLHSWSDEAVNRFAWVSDEVKAAGLELLLGG
jgi:hypothetical protein